QGLQRGRPRADGGCPLWIFILAREFLLPYVRAVPDAAASVAVFRMTGIVREVDDIGADARVSIDFGVGAEVFGLIGSDVWIGDVERNLAETGDVCDRLLI